MFKLTKVLLVVLVTVPIFAESMTSTQTVRRTPNSDGPDGIITLPQLVTYHHPFYTDEARKQAIEGTVTVEATIDIAGLPGNVRTLNTLGFGLDENAKLAVREWRFTPGRMSERPAAMTVLLDIDFKLGNSPDSDLLRNVVSVRDVVVEPQIISQVEPEYSDQAKSAGVFGAVVMDAVILEDGSVKVAHVVRSIGSGLDANAIKAIEQWKFSPAMKDGKAVRIRTDVEVNFEKDK